MKLKLMVLLMAVIFYGCNRKPKNHNPPLAPTELSTDAVVSNAELKPNNSLDYLGLYKGKLPCADCAGIETSLQLSEGFTYTLTQKRLGKNERSIEQKGAYSWNKDETAIILDNLQEGSNQYLVGDKMLTQLDNGKKLNDGNRILRKLSEAEGEKSDAPVSLPVDKQPVKK